MEKNTLLERATNIIKDPKFGVEWYLVVFDPDPQISGVVRYDEKEYPCYVDQDVSICGCIYSFVHRKMCKHSTALLLYSLREKKITKEVFDFLVEVNL